MDQLDQKTAIITGAASGMGRTFADRFARAGMNVVLADIEEPALRDAVSELTAAGHRAHAVVTDVSSEPAMAELAAAAEEHFGGHHLVCLNAGVGGGNGPMHTLSTNDWAWTLDVNLWGVINGIGTLVPKLIDQDDGHVVITASIAGLTSYPGMGPYNVSKHAAVAIAETLFSELRDAGSAVGVTCLCPGLVATNIFQSERNRPEHRMNAGPLVADPVSADDQARFEAIIEVVAANAKDPAMVADLVHDAVVERRFWVHTDDDFAGPIEDRARSIIDRTDPPARIGLLDHYSL